MPKLSDVKKPKCVACGGTGKNSRGGPCYPCQIRQVAVKSVPKKQPKHDHDLLG